MGIDERSTAGSCKAARIYLLWVGDLANPHPVRVERALLFRARSAYKEDCQAPVLYPPALPTGPPGLVMRQGSRSSVSRFSGRTCCSFATSRTVLPDL